MDRANQRSSDPALIWLRPERARQQSRPSLSREEITRAAVHLADTKGLESVTIRRLASVLGAGANSLYWYIASKDDLFELMADEVIGEIELPDPPSAGWRTDLRTIAHNTHHVFRRHGWIVLLGIQPGLGPKTRRYGHVAMTALAGLGLDAATQINVLATLNNFLFGFAHRESAWKQLHKRAGLTERQWHARLEQLLEESRQEDPELAEYIDTRLSIHDQESFEFGLTCLLDGFAALASGRHLPTS